MGADKLLEMQDQCKRRYMPFPHSFESILREQKDINIKDVLFFDGEYIPAIRELFTITGRLRRINIVRRNYILSEKKYSEKTKSLNINSPEFNQPYIPKPIEQMPIQRVPTLPENKSSIIKRHPPVYTQRESEYEFYDRQKLLNKKTG